MSDFDLTDLMDSFKKDLSKAKSIINPKSFGLGDDLSSVSEDPKDYVVMPPWWKTVFGVHGLPFGKQVQIAGEPDSGKTTLSIEAMRRAQEQGCIIVYVETEGKTGGDELASKGVDPKCVITIENSVTEEIYDSIRLVLDKLYDTYPDDTKVLLVIDSYGNTMSNRDANLELTTQKEKPGGHGKTNRTGLGQIQMRMKKHPIAFLLVNYTYDNLGSVGKTNAGGKAANFFCMLTIQSSRKAWYERTIQGQKVRAGADVLWRVYKNHFVKALRDKEGNTLMLPKEVVLRISDDGIHPLNLKEDK